MLAGPERVAGGEVQGSLRDWRWVLCPPPQRTWSYLVAGVALESNLLNCVCKITGGEASASACNEGERSQKKALNFPRRLNIQITNN